MSVISGWPCHPLMHLNCLFFINVNKMYSTNLFRDSITSENCLQNIVKFWRRADNYHDIYSISIACLLQSILSRFRKGVRRYEKTISIFKKKDQFVILWKYFHILYAKIFRNSYNHFIDFKLLISKNDHFSITNQNNKNLYSLFKHLLIFIHIYIHSYNCLQTHTHIYMSPFKRAEPAEL